MSKNVSDAASLANLDRRRAWTLRRTGLFLFKLGVGTAITAWLISTGRLSLSSYGELFVGGRIGLVAGMIFVQLAAFSVFISRWWFLVRMHGIDLSFGDILRTGYQGLFANLVIPGSLGLDGIRLFHLQKNHRARLPAGVASLLIDRAIGLLAMLTLCAMASFLFWLEVREEWVGLLSGISVALVMVGVIVLAYAVGLIPGNRIRWLRKLGPVARIIEAFAIYRNHIGALILAFGISLLGNILVCVSWWLGALALSQKVPIMATLAITPVLVALRTIPTTPLGLGVTDGVAEVLFNLAGYPIGAELQMLVRIASVTIFLACGLAYFNLRPGSRQF